MPQKLRVNQLKVGEGWTGGVGTTFFCGKRGGGNDHLLRTSPPLSTRLYSGKKALRTLKRTNGRLCRSILQRGSRRTFERVGLGGADRRVVGSSANTRGRGNKATREYSALSQDLSPSISTRSIRSYGVEESLRHFPRTIGTRD